MPNSAQPTHLAYINIQGRNKKIFSFVFWCKQRLRLDHFGFYRPLVLPDNNFGFRHHASVVRVCNRYLWPAKRRAKESIIPESFSMSKGAWHKPYFPHWFTWQYVRVSVQGVKSLGGHFACLCWGFDFYEVKNYYYFSKRKGKYFYTFNHFYSEKSSKRAK